MDRWLWSRGITSCQAGHQGSRGLAAADHCGSGRRHPGRDRAASFLAWRRGEPRRGHGDLTGRLGVASCRDDGAGEGRISDQCLGSRGRGQGDGAIPPAPGAVDEGFDEEAILGFFSKTVTALSNGDVRQTVELAAGVAGEPWYPILQGLDETPEAAGFLAGILDFEPGPFLEELACPFLSCFGAADNLVPVDASAAALAPLLSRHTSSGLLVFPGADHGIFVAPPEPDVERRSQLAPGFLAAIEGFLARV